MNIIQRLQRAAWFSFETYVDAIMARGFGVYSYPPTSPEPVRSDPHRADQNKIDPFMGAAINRSGSGCSISGNASL